MSLTERELLQRSKAGEMKELVETYGLSKREVNRILYPNSDDPIFPYTGSPQAQAAMIAAEREEGGGTADIPAGSQATGQRAVQGAHVETPSPGEEEPKTPRGSA